MLAPQITERDNFIWLLMALAILLFTDALVTQLESPQARLLVNISFVFTLFIAVWSLERGRRRWQKCKLGLTFGVACLMIADSVIAHRALELTLLVGCFLFLSLSLYMVWKQVVFSGHVDTNKIVGSICIYILLGMIWAFVYLITEEVFPGSFSGLDHEAWQGEFEQFTYYSMVTLTTVGYGDINPEQALARFLSYMEGITGIFYTTILVASLIGVRLVDGRATAAGSPSQDLSGETGIQR
jgi:drug/metabolite transporter (DMT)-like permease